MNVCHLAITAALTLLLSCNPAPATAPTDCDRPKNEVLILGTIHSGHLTDTSTVPGTRAGSCGNCVSGMILSCWRWGGGLVLCQADLVILTAASFTRWLRCLNPHLATAKLRFKRLASRQNSPTV
ncbi:MAG: hypothetical protein AB8H12_16300, partial [Lewinella sp.]